MHIVNIMFSSDNGGIQQSFVDYCQALAMRGHRVSAVISPDAAVLQQLQALGIELFTLRNIGFWDMMARLRLKKILRPLSPDVVIGHGMRAYALGRFATRGLCPMVGVTHNYSTKRLRDADGVFAITRPLRDYVANQGVEASRIFLIPNMIRCQPLPPRPPYRNPPVIGAMGRFVTKKGFAVFIQALQVLKKRGVEYRAVLGGGGENNEQLIAEAKACDIPLSFPGWVKDKNQFFSDLDLFCLPSLHEPFGIVLLEAFAHGVPVVSSDSEGPADIIQSGVDALIVPKNDANALADALEHLLNNPAPAELLAQNGRAKAMAEYEMPVVAQKMEQALVRIVANYANKKAN